MIGEVQMTEQGNIAMNKFIEKLVGKMQEKGIYTLLVKGQGIVQCYERPLWRQSGDVGLMLCIGTFFVVVRSDRGKMVKQRYSYLRQIMMCSLCSRTLLSIFIKKG